MIWECYTHERGRSHNWQEELAQLWRVVERNIANLMPGEEARSNKPFTFYTHPNDPAFEEGYQEFLQAIGYAPDLEFPKWWSKSSGEVNGGRR